MLCNSKNKVGNQTSSVDFSIVPYSSVIYFSAFLSKLGTNHFRGQVEKVQSIKWILDIDDQGLSTTIYLVLWLLLDDYIAYLLPQKQRKCFLDELTLRFFLVRLMAVEKAQKTNEGQTFLVPRARCLYWVKIKKKVQFMEATLLASIIRLKSRFKKNHLKWSNRQSEGKKFQKR